MDCPDCKANHWEGKRRGCDIHVDCDDLACEALEDPQTYDELSDAVVHWRDHSYISGCSHGA